MRPAAGGKRDESSCCMISDLYNIMYVYSFILVIYFDVNNIIVK